MWLNKQSPVNTKDRPKAGAGEADSDFRSAPMYHRCPPCITCASHVSQVPPMCHRCPPCITGAPHVSHVPLCIIGAPHVSHLPLLCIACAPMYHKCPHIQSHLGKRKCSVAGNATHLSIIPLSIIICHYGFYPLDGITGAPMHHRWRSWKAVRHCGLGFTDAPHRVGKLSVVLSCAQNGAVDTLLIRCCCRWLECPTLPTRLCNGNWLHDVSVAVLLGRLPCIVAQQWHSGVSFCDG